MCLSKFTSTSNLGYWCFFTHKNFFTPLSGSVQCSSIYDTCKFMQSHVDLLCKVTRVTVSIW